MADPTSIRPIALLCLAILMAAVCSVVVIGEPWTPSPGERIAAVVDTRIREAAVPQAVLEDAGAEVCSYLDGGHSPTWVFFHSQLTMDARIGRTTGDLYGIHDADRFVRAIVPIMCPRHAEDIEHTPQPSVRTEVPDF